MIVSKGWDYPLLKHNNWETITTGFVVEPSPGVNYRPNGEQISNIQLDCGSIENFDYDKFQDFVDTAKGPECYEGRVGWYMPILFHRKTFVSYPNRIKFPHTANDILLIDHILPTIGYKFNLVKSFVYHFSANVPPKFTNLAYATNNNLRIGIFSS